jgi:hypothetical protein
MQQNNYDCLYVTGCSFTHGDGLEESVRQNSNWAGLIGARLNLPVVNQSRGGGSNDMIYRVAVTGISQLLAQSRKPLVIICWTARHRREIFDIQQNRYRSVMPPFDNNMLERFRCDRAQYDQLYFEHYSTDDDDIVKTMVYQIGLQSFLDRNRVAHMYTSVWGLVPPDPRPYQYLRRQIRETDFCLIDLYDRSMNLPCLHPNAAAHQLIADQLLLQLSRQGLIPG